MAIEVVIGFFQFALGLLRLALFLSVPFFYIGPLFLVDDPSQGPDRSLIDTGCIGPAWRAGVARMAILACCA